MPSLHLHARGVCLRDVVIVSDEVKNIYFYILINQKQLKFWQLLFFKGYINRHLCCNGGANAALSKPATQLKLRQLLNTLAVPSGTSSGEARDSCLGNRVLGRGLLAATGKLLSLLQVLLVHPMHS